MPASIAVQSAIAQRYAQLGNAVTHNPAEEERVLAPQFQDRAKFKLTSFECDPLTIVVQDHSTATGA